MATLTQNTNWEKSFTLTKQSNSIYTLSTSGQYVDRDIKLTMNVRSASAAANTATADAVLYTTDGSNAGVNISSVIGTKVTTEPSSGYYIAVTASGSGSSKITQAGWIETGALTSASSSGVKYFPIASASCAVAGGELTVNNNFNATPTLSLINGSDTNLSNISLGTKNTATYAYYFKIEGNTNSLSGNTKVTRSNITDTHTAGYLPAQSATTVISSASVTPTVTVNATSNSVYLNIKAATCTVAGGDLVISNSYTNTPTVTLSNGSDTNMSNITIGNKNTATYAYYFKVHGASSALSGNTTVTRNPITDAHTAGYLPAKEATTVINTTSASPSVTINAGSSDTYINIKQGALSVAGGDLSKGDGTATLSNNGYYNGTSYNTSDVIDFITSANPMSGYYSIKAVGSGKVNRAAITKQITTAGYFAADANASTVISASNNYSSNNGTATYYIKKSTLSTSAVTSSSALQSIVIGAGYYPSNREITVAAMTPTVPTTSYSNEGMSTYFTAGTSQSHNVSITPVYSNTTAGYLDIHSNYNNGGIGYWNIRTTSLTQGTSSLSGTTLTRGYAYNGTGWISSTTMALATFANTATNGVTYLDISNTSAAPILISNNYLYINKGYTDNFKISLARLVPDAANIVDGNDSLLQGITAYDSQGNLITGTIPQKSNTDIITSGNTITIPYGYYSASQTVSITAAVGQISMSAGSGSCSLTNSANITTSNSDSYNNGITVQFTGSGSVSADANITTAGYAATTMTFSGTKTISSNTANITKYIQGVTLNKPSSGESKFAITVPNGDSTITFVFHVDTSGNVYVDDQI